MQINHVHYRGVVCETYWTDGRTESGLYVHLHHAPTGACFFLTLVDNHIIMCTHGHLYGVKTGLTALSYAADEIGADIVLYGHTHIPDITNYNNKWFINPGSLGRPLSPVRTYCILTIDKDKIKPELKEF